MKYRVGGCVRDTLLGITPSDIDWVEIDLTEDELVALDYIKVGREFPVYLHPETREEVALPRRHGSISQKLSVMDADLMSRDLTINAMIMNQNGLIHDPTGGRKDLRNKVLRHCDDQAFQDDPIRVLRTARFLSRYGEGWTVAPETERLIRHMGNSGQLHDLTAERVWAELHRALGEEEPWKFFEFLQKLDVLKYFLPEVASLDGVPQRPDYHPEVDTFLHTMMVLKRACELTMDPVIRWACLLHDTGKGRTPKEILPAHHNHEEAGARMNDVICKRLKTPNTFRHLAVLVARYHAKVHNIMNINNKTLHSMLVAMGHDKNYTVIFSVATCCIADAQGRKGWELTAYPQERILKMAGKAVENTKLSDLACSLPSDGKKIQELIYRHELRQLGFFRLNLQKNSYLKWSNSPWSAPIAQQLHQQPR